MSEQSSRLRAREQRAQRRRQAQMRLIIWVSVGAVVLVGGIVLLTVLSKPDVEEADETFFDGLTQSADSSGTGYALGSAAAPVTVVEFSDFSCPHCRDLSDIIHRIIDEYVRDGQVRIVYKPITFVNPSYSTPAGQAAICAGAQGKFWQMHDAIWSLYDLGGSASAYSSSSLAERASALGLDMDQFDACYDSADTRAIIEAVQAEAQSLGLTGTPAVYVNGQQVGYTGKDTFYNDLVAAIAAQ